MFACAVAAASTPITVTASPQSVARGQQVTLRGAGWGVIEFCKAQVTLTLRRAAPLADLPIATVKLRTHPTAASGTFSMSWTVPRSVHPGLRTITATQHCESGKNGASKPIVRTTALRVR